MKLTSSQLNKLKQFASSCISKNDAWHNMFHIEETARLARYLAKKEKADINKCVVAAYMHDIAKNKQSEAIDHGTEGAEMAKEFLETMGLNKKDIGDICYAIHHHNKGKRKRTKEAGILWDADKLQAMGSCGILRLYGWHIFKGQGQEEAYRNYCKDINFYARRFHTKTGKKLAQEYSKFNKIFDNTYKKQLSLK